ncbi:hypothetical protein FRC09_017605 [Ceratobasidium sp. 395]|nr:hypothetical protein FRC09_017605 [Ceratobasidium sp. 395]
MPPQDDDDYQPGQRAKSRTKKPTIKPPAPEADSKPRPKQTAKRGRGRGQTAASTSRSRGVISSVQTPLQSDSEDGSTSRADEPIPMEANEPITSSQAHAGPVTEPVVPSTGTSATIRTPTDPVAGLPGVFTDRHLRRIGFGVLLPYRVFYCLYCKFDKHEASHIKQLGICVDHIRQHILDEHSAIVNTSHDAQVSEVLNKHINEYGVWKGPQGRANGAADAPVPPTFGPPISILPIKRRNDTPKRWGPKQCKVCRGPHPYIALGSGAFAHHLEKVHGITGIKQLPRNKKPVRVTAVQSFHSGSSYQRWFPVDVSAIPDMPLEDGVDCSIEEKAAAARVYVDQVMQGEQSPARTAMGPSHDLGRETGFLHRQGWPEQVTKRNAPDMVFQVSEPGKNDQLSKLHQCCQRLFNTCTATIRDTSSQVLRVWLDSDVNLHKHIKLFQPVEDAKTRREYCRTLTQLMFLVLETSRRLDAQDDPDSEWEPLSDNGEPKYIARLTDEQRQRAQAVWELFDSNSSLETLTEGIYALALSCFAPKDPAAMTLNKFNDIVHVYIMLKSINEDRSFRSTDKLMKSTSGMQYLFRAVLLHKATIESQELGANAKLIFSYYQQYLIVEDMVNPFGALKAIRRQLGFDISRHHRTADFKWVNLPEKTIGIYKEDQFETKDIQHMAQFVAEKTEDMITKEVLFDIPLNELGFSDPDFENLFDVLEDTTLGYSVWTESRNEQLSDMGTSLHQAFIRHAKMDGVFWKKRLDSGAPDWDDGARREWLEKLGKATLHLMLLGYSKTTSITGLDRMDIHALPPRITRLMFILNALIRPLAVQWVCELYDDAPASSEDLELVDVVPETSRAKGKGKMPMTSGNKPNTAVAANSSDNSDLDEESSSDSDAYSASEPEDESDVQVDLEDMAPPVSKVNPKEATINKSPPSDDSLKPSQLQNELAFASCGRPFSPKALSDLLRQFTKEFVGVEWGVQAWRHVCTAIQRAHLRYIPDQDEISGDNILDLQEGHTTRIADEFYAVEEDDRTLRGSSSIAKYVDASQRLHDWLDGKPIVFPPTRVEKMQNDISALNEKVVGLEDTVEKLLGQNAEMLTLIRALVSAPLS